MTSDDDRHLSEERARAVWQLAARLQAEAAGRPAAHADDAGAPPPDGFRLAEVRAAAAEAGISPELVDLAVAELESGGDGGEGLTGWRDRAATRLLGAERALEVSRVIARPAAAVYDAMRHVLPAAPYCLTLREAVGDDPPRGAVLVFGVPELDPHDFLPFAQHAHVVAVKHLRFALRPVSEQACELSVSAGLDRGVRESLRAAGSVAAISGIAGTLAGTYAAGALALVGGAALLPMAAGALAVGALGTWSHGAMYRHHFRKLVADLERLLQSVEAHARTGGSFAPVSPGRGASSSPLKRLLGRTTLEP